jgi:beta-N-acetylhexosaminidase
MTTKRLTIWLCLICMLLCGCETAVGVDRFTNPTVPKEWVPATTAAPTTVPTTAPAPVFSAEAFADSLTLQQQVAQMFFIHCPAQDAQALISRVQPGGVILFGQNITGKTPDTLRAELESLNAGLPYPLLVAVDEEGGSVSRISSNPAFRLFRFPSPRQAYLDGGEKYLLEVEAEKAALLKSLGIRVNLAPVCDVVNEKTAFLADRSLQLPPETTGDMIAKMVTTMQQGGVGAVLKHFPGYGNCDDTHVDTVVDDRTLDQFRKNDLIPFQKGIEAGAGAVMVCHNIVNTLDPSMPASLSPEVNKLLREELKFGGVIITDDLIMDAISSRYDSGEAAVLAILAGNDMLITTWSDGRYQAVLDAVNQGRISPERIRESAVRILQWKLDIGLIK